MPQIQKFVSFLSCFLLLFTFQHAFGQLSAPQAESVYGGRIIAITGIGIAPDTSRIFVSTESANSAFFMDVAHHGMGMKPGYGKFQVLAGMDASAGFGSGIREMSAHGLSSHLYFIHEGNLFHTHPTSSVVSAIDSMGVQTLLVNKDQLFYVKGAELIFGTLDAAGKFSQNPAAPILLPPGLMQVALSVHPVNRRLYIFGKGNNPALYKTTHAYDSLDATSTLTAYTPTVLHGAFDWSAFSIAPDGRMFAAGSNFTQKKIAYANNDSTWIQYASGFGGAPGWNISFGGDASFYQVYYANMRNDSLGMPGRWSSFGTMGRESHPNDGPVWGDPANFEVVYMSTDMGIGASHNHGASIYEVNDGIEAIQVNDFDMTLVKNTAWLASKSGIRKVSSYKSGPSWTGPFFPMMDGSPYYATAMAGQDTNTVYACNLRVYKTTNGGMMWQRLFTAEDPPYNYPSAGNLITGAAQIHAVEVCPFDTSIVMVGYGIQWGENGGLFYSHDGGANWQQQLIHASASGYDVNVQDVIFAEEGADTVAYVGVRYNNGTPTGYSVYRLVKNGINWIVQQDMGASGTSTGSAIVVSIADIAKSPTGDTLLACGTDVGSNHPVAYYKDVNGTNLWTPFTTSGFPFSSGKVAKAATYGIDTVYVAVDEEIYYLPVGASAWTLGYTYPKGTQIQFLYYDELLVGTETGLYGHQGQSPATKLEAREWEYSVDPVNFYPNPTKSFPMIMELKEPTQSTLDIRVYNALGQLIGSRRFYSGKTFSLDEKLFAGAGVYFVEVASEEVQFIGKIMISR